MSTKIDSPTKWLKWVAVITTAVYIVVFFSKMMMSYSAWRAAGLDNDWTVPENPQSMIALCFLTATLALWFLHDGGKVLAFLLFIVVIGFFYRWATLTNDIKLNMGLKDIPHANWIDNLWFGANALDPIVLLITTALLGLDSFLLVKHRKQILSRIRNLHPLHP